MNQPLSEEEKKKRHRYVRYSPVSLIALAVCTFVFCYCLSVFLDSKLLETTSAEEKAELYQSAFNLDEDGVYSPSEGGGNLIPSSSVTGKWKALSPYDINVADLPFLAEVDFASLLKKNKETVCWLYWPTTVPVTGLPLNISVVQKENDLDNYYLNHSFNGSKNENGWVFADLRCDLSTLSQNRNTVFYGHARSYKMFGGLKYLNTKTKWQQDGYNHFIYINTPTERTVWEVFSWYETNAYINYIETNFQSDADFMSFLEEVQSKNQIDAFRRFNLTADDRIITMSTCKGSDPNARVAVHAVLVKSEKIENSLSTDTDTELHSDSSGSDRITDATDTKTTTKKSTSTKTTDKTTNTKTTSSKTDVTTDTETNSIKTNDVSTASNSSGQTTTDSERITTDTVEKNSSSEEKKTDSEKQGDVSS